MDEYRKIDKRKARKLYEEKKPVYILPCKANPHSIWFTGFQMVNEGRTFDQYVNEFSYYNCCAELGRTPAFYVKERELE